MRPKTLSVLTAPHAKLTVAGALKNAPRHFIGWDFVPTASLSAQEAGKEFMHPKERVQLGHFIQRAEAETVPYHLDHLTHLKKGDWLPADEATAKVAGLPWSKN